MLQKLLFCFDLGFILSGPAVHRLLDRPSRAILKRVYNQRFLALLHENTSFATQIGTTMAVEQKQSYGKKRLANVSTEDVKCMC